MLQRASQVGEFYRMAPPAVFDETKQLPSSYMDILVYDEEADKLQHIEFEQALYATCAGSMNGAEINALLGGDSTKDKITPLLDQIDASRALITKDTSGKDNKLTEPAKPTIALSDGDAGEKLVNHLVKAVKAGICVKICITLARPFIEHLMLSAVAAVSGRDTGATLYGPADMQISANTSVKTIEGACNAHQT